MNTYVYVDPMLLEGVNLRVAHFVKEFDNSWVIQSETPKTNKIDEYVQLDKADVLQRYPELKELFDLKPDKTMFFRKGINSGKWYDFC